MAERRAPTHDELERLTWLQGDEEIDESVPGWIEPPCQRPGSGEDWWRQQHDYCTGGRHLAAALVVICACECHLSRDHTILPAPVAPNTIGSDSDG